MPMRCLLNGVRLISRQRMAEPAVSVANDMSDAVVVLRPSSRLLSNRMLRKRMCERYMPNVSDDVFVMILCSRLVGDGCGRFRMMMNHEADIMATGSDRYQNIE